MNNRKWKQVKIKQASKIQSEKKKEESFSFTEIIIIKKYNFNFQELIVRSTTVYTCDANFSLWKKNNGKQELML